MASTPSLVLKTPVVRLSYPTLFEARAMRNEDGSEGKPFYGATFHFDERSKKDPKYQELMTALVKEVNMFTQKRWPDEFAKAKQPWLDDSTIKTPWLDPNSPKYRDKAEMKGVTRFVRTKSNRRVPCVDRKALPITDAELLYAGCYVYAMVAVYTYSNKGNFGPGFGLRAIQFVEDADRLDGGIDVSEAFGSLDDADDTPFDTQGGHSPSKSSEDALRAMFA